ncbi:hypothetical protein NDU88_004644 [Pleurodeles waltl]|uniref:Uncharacterized protein n=1 Tax=Pleurodeles waltl TaxID=8319 RepID=A0AAV7W9K7_PLEWA|nr:hypothetical protein NDU88_004644 [Pleurodeles waltl]
MAVILSRVIRVAKNYLLGNAKTGLTKGRSDRDDILVFGGSEQEHDERVKEVLKKINEVNLTVKEFRFMVDYVPGAINQAADALSKLVYKEMDNFKEECEEEEEDDTQVCGVVGRTISEDDWRKGRKKGKFACFARLVNKKCADMGITDVEWKKVEVVKGVAREKWLNAKKSLKKAVLEVVDWFRTKNQ